MKESLQRALERAAVCPNPVFIVGAPRSGTTALARALTHHDDFWSSEETFILYGLFAEGRLESQFARWRARPSPSWFTAQDVDFEEFAGFLGLGMNALFTDRSGGKRWIDHTPHHVFMIDVLAQMFPGAYFLHIVRDGRSVVASMINFIAVLDADSQSRMIEGQFVPSWQSDFGEACRAWRDSVDAGRSASLQYPDRCLEVSYERLTIDPDTEFRALLERLQARHLDWPAEYWQSKVYNSSFQQDGPPELTGLLAGRTRWAAWDPEQRALFRAEAGETLVKLGLANEEELSLEEHSVAVGPGVKEEG